MNFLKVSLVGLAKTKYKNLNNFFGNQCGNDMSLKHEKLFLI
jgi:hypothetical protein